MIKRKLIVFNRKKKLKEYSDAVAYYNSLSNDDPNRMDAIKAMTTAKYKVVVRC